MDTVLRGPSYIHNLFYHTAYTLLYTLPLLDRCSWFFADCICGYGEYGVAYVTPNRLRGRIMSVYMLVFAGTNPIGNLFIGGLAHAFGVTLALFIRATLSLLAAIVGWILHAPAVKGMTEQARLEH